MPKPRTVRNPKLTQVQTALIAGALAGTLSAVEGARRDIGTPAGFDLSHFFVSVAFGTSAGYLIGQYSDNFIGTVVLSQWLERMAFGLYKIYVAEQQRTAAAAPEPITPPAAPPPIPILESPGPRPRPTKIYRATTSAA